MESDPILTYAPRRNDGRLGMHQWPSGHPVSYDPYDGPSEGDVCGDCASVFERKGAEFRAWGVLTSRFYFRCQGCKNPVFHAATDHLSYPMPGFAAAEKLHADRIRVQLLDGRLSRIPVEADSSGKYILFVPCHLVYPYFASLTEKGIGPESPFFEQAMDAIDLHSSLRAEMESARKTECDFELRHLRRLQPRHLETTARIALALEKAGRKAEAAWEWENLGEAFQEAGFLDAANSARKGLVLF